MDLDIVRLSERPDLRQRYAALDDTWPEFITRDPIGGLYYNSAVRELFADHILLALAPDDTVVAAAHSIPYWSETDELGDDGWDGAIRRGVHTRLIGREPNRLAALEITIGADFRGLGLSRVVVVALRDHARDLGFAELVVPVRPNGKTDPHESMESYARKTRTDGLPVDPWLRVHVRAGGVIDKVAPRAMVIPGTLAEWREWTGLPFDTSGPVVVPEALAPVLCSVEHQVAVYVEANVWVRHRTGAAGGRP